MDVLWAADEIGTRRDDADADASDLHAAVAAVMARLADGEQPAMWDLYDLAWPALEGMVRNEARRIGVQISREDVVDLGIDAAIELSRVAPAWRADGALPWVWARWRVFAVVRDHIGQLTRQLDDAHLDREDPPLPGVEESPRATLRAVARRHAGARALDARLSATVSDRDAEIWLAVQMEKAAGNRSPAVTVAVDHGLSAVAVRKVVQRVGQRLGSTPEALTDVA